MTKDPDSLKHPIQPLYVDANEILRFNSNKIVAYLAEGRLNEIASMGFSNQDHEQVAQLIGYSLCGFGDLSYVSDETYETAAKMAMEGVTEQEARIAYLTEKVDEFKKLVRAATTSLFNIDPDDME